LCVNSATDIKRANYTTHWISARKQLR
jgi:hypothetical protein